MKRGWLNISGLLLAPLALLWIFSVQDPGGLHSPRRKRWKEQALSNLRQWSGDRTWLTNELARCRTGDTNLPAGLSGWISQHVILLQNGDWMVYSATCWKEPPGIPDIFLGRGSDGKWYYSTYHFCVGMCALDVLDATPPASLGSFAQSYSLREFDGHSDECLNQTWFPGSKRDTD